jgi:Asp-tRNA(Asn)/Glu-tRNA(Gln) amidotransferase C subunit
MSDSKSEKEYMMERIKTLYGDRLDEEQLKAVEASLDPIIMVLEQLRSIPLENSDEPYSVFKPYRKDEK